MVESLESVVARLEARKVQEDEDHVQTQLELFWLPDTFFDARGARGQFGWLRAFGRGGLPMRFVAVRSIDDNDWVMPDGIYLMSMERMVAKKRDAILFEAELGLRPKKDDDPNVHGEWVRLEELAHRGGFIHHVGRSRLGWQVTATPSMLDGCTSIGMSPARDGVDGAVDAQGLLHEHLGGWEPGKKFLLRMRALA